MNQPYQYQTPPPPPPVVPWQQPVQVKTSALAVTSLILGCLSFLLFPGIPALVLGLCALSAINKSNGQLIGRGMAIAGTTLGGLGTAGFLFFFMQGLAAGASS